MKTWNDIARLMLTTAVAGAVSLGAMGVLAKGNPGAKSVDQLTADWWEWAEKYGDYVFEPGMVDCSLGQKAEIWFLAGTVDGLPTSRECMDPIPAGKRLFFPLVNFNFANNDAEDLSVLEKRELLNSYINDVEPNFGVEACNLTAVVDDEPVIFSGTPIQRVQSPTFMYTATNGDGTLAEPDPETVSDGFWVMLPPLAPGEHTIKFTGGLCLLDTGVELFGVDVMYVVTIVE